MPDQVYIVWKKEWQKEVHIFPKCADLPCVTNFWFHVTERNNCALFDYNAPGNIFLNRVCVFRNFEWFTIDEHFTRWQWIPGFSKHLKLYKRLVKSEIHTPLFPSSYSTRSTSCYPSHYWFIYIAFLVRYYNLNFRHVTQEFRYEEAWFEQVR